MPLLSRRLFSYFPNAMANRDFSCSPLSFLSVATETVYKARGSYRIRQEVGAPCSLPNFVLVSLVSSRRRRLSSRSCRRPRRHLVVSSLSLVPLLVLLVASRPYLGPLLVPPTTVALWSSTLSEFSKISERSLSVSTFAPTGSSCSSRFVSRLSKIISLHNWSNPTFAEPYLSLPCLLAPPESRSSFWNPRRDQFS